MNRPAELRRAIRAGRFQGLTVGAARGYVQCNLAVVPGAAAEEFAAFCRANPTACPVLATGAPGDWRLPALGADLDLRTDLPGYLVYRDGRRLGEVRSIADFWRRDLVAFVIGCWFSLEDALAAAGVRMRHVELGIQGPLFATDREAVPGGRFHGPLIVSMRPFAAAQVETVAAVTARFPRVHGAPIHRGDPAALGIADTARPDYGEPIDVLAGEVPLFWGCGLTALAALERSGLDFFATHAPGKMLVTDLRNESLADREAA